ncbi:MAG: cell division protein ZapA [Cellvibrionales bacterium]|nr:cell division protein ZapA [Cellvibrionales bacterium]
MPPNSPVTIRLLDKPYQINCDQEAREDLLESARLLNSRLLEIKKSGTVIGLERMAIMAALNLSHELVRLQKQGDAGRQLGSGLARLQEKISAAIESLNPPR